ncbi:recombinase family protein [Phyllobacterium endophyticum]|uniref:recombinase family protein n=1 Tax=Phyllobacterium endophyticum TaxID=1149773 RepID=UPI0011CA473C|nr:recombinase family protein [Phyllobacterium endophyticum]TXR50452.1 recombinase family protein [Phyllobacterium endophyticum]
MKPQPRPRLIGYARVSTDEQLNDAQLIELRAAGCHTIFEEQGSGASRARPVLAKLVREIKAGQVLVVARLDRLARSVSHLLHVIEQLEEKGAHFRSLHDPIDTSTPQGMFSLQVLGAVAQLERALISERTKAGINAARARGKLPGNPGLRERRREAIAKTSQARRRGHLAELTATMSSWLPVVQRMRPDHPWEDVARSLNRESGQKWSVDRLRHSVKRLVSEGLADPGLIRPSPRRAPQDRLLSLVTGIANANPDLTFREIASQLEAMHERIPRGSSTWAASSVKHLLDRARKFGLVAQAGS